MWNSSWLQLKHITHEGARSCQCRIILCAKAESFDRSNSEMPGYICRCESGIEFPLLSFSYERAFISVLLRELDASLTVFREQDFARRET